MPDIMEEYENASSSIRIGILGCLALLSALPSSALAQSLNWESGSGYRMARLPVPAIGRTGFSLIPAESTGILFTNVLIEARAMTNLNLFNGSGVALGDFDGDG